MENEENQKNDPNSNLSQEKSIQRKKYKLLAWLAGGAGGVFLTIIFGLLPLIQTGRISVKDDHYELTQQSNSMTQIAYMNLESNYNKTQVALLVGLNEAQSAGSQGNPTATFLAEELEVARETATAFLESNFWGSELRKCIYSPYERISSGWVTDAFFIPAEKGEIKVFSHCSPANEITYDSIAVDDVLSKVVIVCDDSLVDVTNLFREYQEGDELLLHYQSETIFLEKYCRIDFYISDLEGERVGIMIKGSH